MKIFSIALGAAALCLGADLASATAVRTFVSGKGVDGGACTIAAPCRSFAYAVTQTAAAGELVVLDAAGYGTVTISQSISIVNDGVGTASISVPSGGYGISIYAGANDSVQLRGIEIDGNNVGSTGVYVSSGASIDLIDCTIRHNDTALFVYQGNTRMRVQHTSLSDNKYYGLYVFAGNIIVENSTMSRNAYGVVSARQTTYIKNSTISFNTTAGIDVSTSTIFLDQDLVTSNAVGVSGRGGIVYTLQNNSIVGNGTDLSASLTPLTAR